MQTRRKFVASAAALGSGVLSGRALAAEGDPRGHLSAGRDIVDVHNHYGSRHLSEFAANYKSSRELFFIPWNVQMALDDMDSAGVSKAILSQFVPSALGDREARRKLARDLNDEGARIVRDYPRRFGFFATLPIPSIDDCLAEITYGLDVLKADGIAILTSEGQKWLGDPYLDPIYQELDRRHAVVFVHPHAPDCCAGLVPAVPDYIIEFGADTTRAIGNLIWTGTTTRYPNVRFIFSHGGGAMPFLIERFLAGTSAEVVPGIVIHGKSPPFVPKQPPRGVLAELRRMYYDVAQCANPVALRALRQVVPVSQILYGSDFGYRSNAETLQGLINSEVFSPNEVRAVEFDNARALFGW
ncbi:MAG TPA: amidohydrolase family protein [Caulobacteraceae bacterium]|nr:amidohydrolase family protein [Caulobacteraceae bacterium]